MRKKTRKENRTERVQIDVHPPSEKMESSWFFELTLLQVGGWNHTRQRAWKIVPIAVALSEEGYLTRHVSIFVGLREHNIPTQIRVRYTHQNHRHVHKKYSAAKMETCSCRYNRRVER